MTNQVTLHVHGLPDQEVSYAGVEDELFQAYAYHRSEHSGIAAVEACKRIKRGDVVKFTDLEGREVFAYDQRAHLERAANDAEKTEASWGLAAKG